MKFVHAADIHLDSPLCGLKRYEGVPIEYLAGASRRALANLVGLCLEEQVKFLLICGDLFDGDWRDYNTGLFFTKEISRLTREGIRVFIARGNHDASSQIARNLRLPEGATELSTDQVETVRLHDLRVAIHGTSYVESDVFDDLSARYPWALADTFNIGMLHTALNGREGHRGYAPCRLDALLSKGYQYWALGHVHRREVLSSEPWVVFPGNLQGRYARESGPKGATLVTVDNGRVVKVEHRDLDSVRWAWLSVDVSQAGDATDVLDLVRAQLASEAAIAGERIVAARVCLTGVSRAHMDLCRDPEGWKEQIRAVAGEMETTVLVERVLFETRSILDSDSLSMRDDPIGSLIRSIRASRFDSASLQQLGSEIEDLQRQLPPEVQESQEPLDFGDPQRIATFLEEAEQLLLPRLLSSGSN